jgi:hypothetical protein
MLLLPGGAALADSYRAEFDFRVTGIKAGELVMGAEASGDSYSAAARIDTAGLVGAFTDFFFDGTSAGTFSGNGSVIPSRYSSTSKSPRALRETRIDFRGGTPVAVSVEPPRGSAPDPANQAGTLDPVSAGFAILRDAPVGPICNTSVDVFDGSRRSRIRLGAPQPAGNGDLVCAGRFTRLEGEAHSLSSDQDYGFKIVFRENGHGLARLQRIETSTNFGPAVLERR